MGLFGEQEIKFVFFRFGGFLVMVATVTLNDTSHMTYALPRSHWLLYREQLGSGKGWQQGDQLGGPNGTNGGLDQVGGTGVV